MDKEVHIIGAGLHSEVIAEILEDQGYKILSRKVVSDLSSYNPGDRFIVAIGDNMYRTSMSRQLIAAGMIPISVIHPSAIICKSAILGVGVQILENVVISTKAKIGSFSLINIGSIVSHHSVLGQGVQLGSKVTMGGDCRIGDLTSIYNGATLIPKISIGEKCIIGAGAVVIKDTDKNSTYVGNPARRIK